MNLTAQGQHEAPLSVKFNDPNNTTEKRKT